MASDGLPLSIIEFNSVGGVWLHWCLRMARFPFPINLTAAPICISRSSLSAYTALLIAGVSLSGRRRSVAGVREEKAGIKHLGGAFQPGSPAVAAADARM